MSSKVIEIDRGWNRIKKEMQKMSVAEGPHVKVGVLGDEGTWAAEKPKKKVKAGEAAGASANLVDVATFNEFGTSTIPERPFMRQTFENRIELVVQRFRQYAREIIEGKLDTRGALVKVGDEYKGFIQTEIVKGGWTPNAPSTVKQKGSSKPLVDTGRMRDSINFELEMT